MMPSWITRLKRDIDSDVKFLLSQTQVKFNSQRPQPHFQVFGLHFSAFSMFITHICRIKGCGGAGWPPPPIIFERLKLPQQIIYRRKENLSESPNHKKYWENILVSRFYEQFSRNRQNLGYFRKFEKISNS